MSESFSIEKIPKQIGNITKKNPALVAGAVVGTVVLALIVTRKQNNYPNDYYYNEPIYPEQAAGGDSSGGESGLSNEELEKILAEYDDYYQDLLSGELFKMDEYYQGLIEDIESKYEKSIAGILKEYQQTMLPYEPFPGEFPQGITAEQIQTALGDISRNSAMMFSSDFQIDAGQLLSIADWSNEYLSANNAGIITNQELRLGSITGQVITYTPTGQVLVGVNAKDAKNLNFDYAPTYEGNVLKYANTVGAQKVRQAISGISGDMTLANPEVQKALANAGLIEPISSKAYTTTTKPKSNNSMGQPSGGTYNPKNNLTTTVNEQGHIIAGTGNKSIPAGTNLSTIRL